MQHGLDEMIWREVDQYVSARFLLEAIVQFGRKETNPVLTILDGKPAIVEHRYPPDGTGFANDRWRAFYHSHDTPDNVLDEHGHFHIFARLKKGRDDWTHVVGLSVDKEGQPVEWFCANKWVVRGDWYPAEYLKRHLPSVDAHDDKDLTARWLASLLGTYRDEINELLVKRDRFVDIHAEMQGQRNIFEDRSIWKLARTPIELQSKLTSILAPHANAS